MAIVFSDYEERMIGFLMGHGMSQELAEQSVVDERLDQFRDIHHQLTDENQKRDVIDPAVAVIGYMSKDNCRNKKISAFRRHIGESTWRKLCGNITNPQLLELAIDYKYEE